MCTPIFHFIIVIRCNIELKHMNVNCVCRHSRLQSRPDGTLKDGDYILVWAVHWWWECPGASSPPTSSQCWHHTNSSHTWCPLFPRFISVCNIETGQPADQFKGMGIRSHHIHGATKREDTEGACLASVCCPGITDCEFQIKTLLMSSRAVIDQSAAHSS